MLFGILSRCLPYLMAAGFVIGMAFLAGAGAFYVGREAANFQARTVATTAVDRLIDQTRILITSIFAILQEAENSPYPPCSDPDLALLRGLTLQSGSIGDIGRIRNHTLVCSALLGVLKTPIPRPIEREDFVLPSGLHVRMHQPPGAANAGRRPLIFNDRLNAVLSGHFFDGRVDRGNLFEVAFRSRDGTNIIRSIVGHVPAPDSIFQQDTTAFFNGTLISSSCLDGGALCLALGLPPATLQTFYYVDTHISATLGAVAGAGLGGWMVLLYLRSRRLDRRLITTLRRNKLHVIYQPIWDPKNQRTVGAEALARWTLRDKTVVPPDVFIPLAEQHGLTHLITRNVIRCVTRECEQLLRQNPHFVICINISATDLSSRDFVDFLLRSCSSAEIRPAQIHLEITERSAANPELVAPHIGKLREMGYHFLLDDFGTGHSNLTTLSALSVDGLKLDRSFTSAIGTDSAPALIVPRILEMAAALRMNVIAEGVETQEQADYLVAHGTQYMQGWLFGKPAPVQGLTLRLQREAAA